MTWMPPRKNTQAWRRPEICLYRDRMFKATWNENMEVESFPFDVQKLTMAFQCKTACATHDTNIRVNYNGGKAFSSKFVPPRGEWALVEGCCEVRITPSSLMMVSIWVRRNWQFYFFRIMLVRGICAVFAFETVSKFSKKMNHTKSGAGPRDDNICGCVSLR